MSFIKWLLALGAALTVAGFVMGRLMAEEGSILLEKGRRSTLVLKGSNPDSLHTETGLDLFISLDSVSITPHDPVFEIRVRRDVDQPMDEQGPGALPVREIVSRFPLDQMKTREIGQTDFRFRVKSFYPDFVFSYEYPDRRDTIAPKVTGILLDLKTPEGPAIVTLRSDQPGRHRLDDIVGLGSSFTFFWEVAQDAVRDSVSPADTADLKIVFSGVDQRMYYVRDDSLQSFSFSEKQFYALPGRDTFGFTVVYAFPDIDLLRAVPSTRSDQPRHPVAGVEVWKKNGPGQEVFLYPEVRGRVGGQYSIPGTGYSLAMEINLHEEARHANAWISVSGEAESPPQKLQLSGHHPVAFKGYRFSMQECRNAGDGQIMLLIRRHAGRSLLFTGIGLMCVSMVILLFWRKNQPSFPAT